MKKKDFTKFTKRNTHKRKSKDAAKKELLRVLRECGIESDGAKISSVTDTGIPGRKSKVRGEEISARGLFHSSRSDFGFVTLEGGGDDIFIPGNKTHGAIDGDTVEISYKKFKNYMGEEKTEGRVIKIAEYGRRTVIGTLSEEYMRHGRHTVRIPFVQPDDRKINIAPRVRDTAGARVGDKVEALILRDGSAHPDCEIVRIFGDSESPRANYDAILAECEIITEFTKEEETEANKLSGEEISFEGRVDRTADVIFTIDGESAKDLDDAVSLRKLSGGKWRLGVHIADVSHYVKERTPLDRCVMARGTSVYFTDKVVPMLPKALSNGACSLNPNEEKYALSAIIDLDPQGNILKTSIEKSVIRSCVRGVYSEVNALLSGECTADIKKKYSRVMPSLLRMRELYGVLLEKSKKRGSVDFDSDEAVIILDEEGEPIDIVKRERGVAERIIEQFMLTANEAVATYLTERRIPCVYRIHEAPPKEAFSEFLVYLSTLGFDVSKISRSEPTPKDLSEILEEAKRRGVENAVSYTMLRSMAKARYSEIRSDHFGLGIENYCHFTSPIRRLSDLATHRIIKRVLFDEKRAENYSSYARRAAAAATEGELRALRAERKIEDLYKVVYMSGRVGEIFPAEINSVTSFGLFCTLPNTCEGLVPISEMSYDAVFFEKTLAIRADGEAYRVGDRLFVCLDDVDVIRGKLKFSISDESSYNKQKRDLCKLKLSK